MASMSTVKDFLQIQPNIGSHLEFADKKIQTGVTSDQRAEAARVFST